MARTPRKDLVVPGLPHNIGVRGNNKRRLFSYPNDYWRMLWLLDRALRKHDLPMHQLTLMPNHLHLITTPPTQLALSSAMQSCLQRYSYERNLSRGSTGKLFEHRYWSMALDPDSLAGFTLYNDANALMAGLVNAPEDHAWSTCAIHYGQPEKTRIPLSMWTPSPWYASLGQDAALEYRELMLLHVEGDIPGWKSKRMKATATAAALDYRRRIERPDGSSAR